MNHTSYLRLWFALHPIGITFVFDLFAGSVSDREILSWLELSNSDTAILVNRGFLVDNLLPYKVYWPVFFKGEPNV